MLWTSLRGYFWQALVYAWCGERNRALEQSSSQGWKTCRPGPSLGHFKSSPKWDDLRGHARFQKIVASVAGTLEIEKKSERFAASAKEILKLCAAVLERTDRNEILPNQKP
jgi:hypothetical protein